MMVSLPLLVVILSISMCLIVSQASSIRKYFPGSRFQKSRDEGKQLPTCTIKALSNIRAGASGKFNINELIKRRNLPRDLSGNVDVLVTTSLGSTFLNKKKKLTIPANCTISELKVQLETKFAGSPPVSLQKLFHNARYLNDSEIIGTVSRLSPVVITLDMILMF